MVSSRKRYLLLAWDGEMSPEGRRKLARLIEQRHSKAKLITIDGCEGNLIVKTDVEGAMSMRESFADMVIGDKRVVSVLTSGCIGNLKRRARGSAASELGKVSQ